MLRSRTFDKVTQIVRQRLRAFRCKPLLLMTVACLCIGEQFPFSPFPMYSSFSERTDYVYLADDAGRPLPTLRLSGMTTATLKKVYHSELQTEMRRLRTARRRMTPEQKRPAGERTLASIRASRWAQEQGGGDHATLRLYQVNLSLDGRDFTRQTDLIAELP